MDERLLAIAGRDADLVLARRARDRHLLLTRAALHRLPVTVAAAESAAVVWGLPLPSDPPERPVVVRPRTTARPQHGRRGATTVRRAWLSTEQTTLGPQGIPVTTPGRTFVDCARELGVPWSLALADAARRTTGCSVAELLMDVDRHPTAPGHGRARRVALLAEHLVESPLESLARGVQLELGLPRPQVQAWVGEDGPEVRVDMLVAEFATVVEADGRLKYEGVRARRGQVWADKLRQDRLLDLGYDCHRFVAADLSRSQAWGRSLLGTFARSQRRRGLPAPVFRYPWA